MSIENVKPVRPPFSFSRAIEWLLFPALAPLLERSRLPDGTFPYWVELLPNQLSISRLSALPLAGLFCWSVIGGYHAGATVLLAGIILTLLTDAVDGAVARYASVTSAWGQRWDSIFDKVATAALITGWLVMVETVQSSLFGPLLILVLARLVMDLSLALVAAIETRRGLKPKARMWGKIKAGCDSIAIVLGYASLIMVSFGYFGAVVAIGFLSVSCLLAPMSIYEHAANLLRRPVLQSK